MGLRREAPGHWLARAQALAGEVEQARATFRRAIAYTSDVGLLAEEVDPVWGEPLGNYPQAFSHIGLVTAAWAITQAEPHGQGDTAAADRGAPAAWQRPVTVTSRLQDGRPAR